MIKIINQNASIFRKTKTFPEKVKTNIMGRKVSILELHFKKLLVSVKRPNRFS